MGGGGGGEERLGKLFRGKSVLKNFSFPFYTSLSIDLSICIQYGSDSHGRDFKGRDVRRKKRVEIKGYFEALSRGIPR